MLLSNANYSGYKQLSKFNDTDHLNKSIRGFLYKFKHELNPSVIETYRLIANHSVKLGGVAFLKHQSIADGIGKSIPTVKRSLKQLKQLQVLEIHRTKRDKGKVKGGFGHNVFVLCDLSHELSEMNHRENSQKPCELHSEPCKNKTESRHSESSTLVDKKDHNIVMDATFTPSCVQQSFIDVCKSFFNASDVYSLWKRVKIAYNKSKLSMPLETYTDSVVRVLKQTIFISKQKSIKSFNAYFYTGVIAEFSKLKRLETLENSRSVYYNFLEQ